MNLASTAFGIQANGLSHRLIDTGTGEPVLLLHGFPDSFEMWAQQVPPLVERGFRVIAPDLRGFGGTDKPEEVESYALPHVVDDLTAILDHLGIERVHVVGHDWGAAVAWLMAAMLPERVMRLVVISVGNPGAYFRSFAQRERSWYMLFFHFAGVAEDALRQNDWAFFRQWLHQDRSADPDRYIPELTRPGALTAALNWYRANVAPAVFGSGQSEFPAVRCPTMGISGGLDHFCLEDQMAASSSYVEGEWRHERLPSSGHWVPFDSPETLSCLLIGFLSQDPRRRVRSRHGLK